MFRRPLALLLLTVACRSGTAPAAVSPAPVPTATETVMADSAAEAAVIRRVVEDFFTGMRTRDTALMRRTLAPGVTLRTAGGPRGVSAPQPADAFLTAVANGTGPAWNEQLVQPEVLHDGTVATVWTGYTFALGDSVRHCGVDAVHLARLSSGWRMVFLADTRRTTGCASVPPVDDAEGPSAVVRDFVRALVTSDTATVARLVAPDFAFVAVEAARGEAARTDLAGLLRQMAQPAPPMDEQLQAPFTVRQDGPLAEVRMRYRFLVDGRFSHCGTDAFQLVRLPAGWRVLFLTYSLTQAGCGART